MRLLRSFVFTGIARFLSSRGGSSAVSGPAPERHYLTSRGCGGWNAARQPAGLDAAKVAADLLRGLGQRVSGVIACKGDQGGRAPPIGIPTRTLSVVAEGSLCPLPVAQLFCGFALVLDLALSTFGNFLGTIRCLFP